MSLIARIRRAMCIHGIELSPGELSLAMSLVWLDVVGRLAPHAPNVTPIAASAVFAGMVLRSRALALAVPISALLVSDLVAGWHVIPSTQIEVGVSRYFRGDYIKQSLATPGSKDANYCYVQFTLSL